ncbi:hypothetical protein LCGC14_0578890 [marine sediment metagenome]|uniref:Uncharacterized protein n=1 Tax=marine sediment metagenome TaxID=412755 RepID=A0A0F9S0P0_9ZZZZ|nr:hypothetical protein [bacterium]
MRVRKYKFKIIIISFLILSFSFTTLPIAGSVAPVPAIVSPPDQFIAEIFPNSTLPLQLTHSNTIISFNATDFPNKIDINFDANYTIYNSGNTSSIQVILPFSLAIDINDFIFDVYANNSQINYDIFNVSPWNENITEIDINFRIIELYPITLIRSNITLHKNSSSIMRYRFKGSMNNLLDPRDLFYVIYSIGTSQEWIGNTTGRVTLRVYGKQPVYGQSGHGFNSGPPQLVDIIGGKSFRCEWNNTKSPWMSVGIRFYREVSLSEEIMEIIISNLLSYLLIVGIVISAVMIRRKRKRQNI